MSAQSINNSEAIKNRQKYRKLISNLKLYQDHQPNLYSIKKQFVKKYKNVDFFNSPGMVTTGSGNV